MKKKLILIIFIFFISKNVFTLEVTCQFEEVYMDGSNQQGIFYFDNNKLRYQYDSPHLYTLIYDNFELHAVKNNNTNIHQLVIDQYNIVKSLKDISSDYPNFNKNYIFSNQEVIVETNKTENFIKRLAFKSDELNLSIYFQDCQFGDINPKLFSHKNFVHY
tara:strand:- start:673 stop:1155 length:483 start_codon:yes stop_codon:yes gene_type:complete